LQIIQLLVRPDLGLIMELHAPKGQRMLFNCVAQSGSVQRPMGRPVSFVSASNLIRVGSRKYIAHFLIHSFIHCLLFCVTSIFLPISQDFCRNTIMFSLNYEEYCVWPRPYI